MCKNSVFRLVFTMTHVVDCHFSLWRSKFNDRSVHMGLWWIKWCWDSFFPSTSILSCHYHILHEIRKRKANWIGHILRRNCLLKEVIEGKIKGRIEVTRRRGGRRKKFMGDLGDRRGYSDLEEEALDRNKWRNRFGRGCRPVVWQITDDDELHIHMLYLYVLYLEIPLQWQYSFFVSFLHNVWFKIACLCFFDCLKTKIILH
jgi:hypothetical protein